MLGALSFSLFAALVFAILSCMSPGLGAAAPAVVHGTAAFGEAIAIPPGAELEVVVQNVSRADAPAITVGRTALQDIGQPPYRFEIAYEPSQIVDNHTYSVRARLTHEGRLLFTTDRFYPVITRGGPHKVQLDLKPVGALREKRAPGSDRDAHGCIGSAGYVWCARDGACVRVWELAAARGFPNRPEAFQAYCAAPDARPGP